jgi:hypothetical protein
LKNVSDKRRIEIQSLGFATLLSGIISNHGYLIGESVSKVNRANKPGEGACPILFYRKQKTENPFMQDAIIKEIAATVGLEHVLTSPEDRWTYAYDATDLSSLPDLVMFPGSAEEISAIIKLADQHRFPVVPRGAGSGRAGGSWAET